MRRAAVLLTVLATGLALGSCAADDHAAPSPSAPTTGATGPVLIPLWSRQVDDPAATTAATTAGTTAGTMVDPTAFAGVTTWQADGVLVQVTHGGAVGLDAATGEPRWTYTPPARLGTVCAATPTASPTGTGGLLLGPGASTCTSAVLLDIATGQARWSTELDHDVLGGSTPPQLVLDRTTFTVSDGFCDGAVRLRLDTGRATHDRVVRGCARTALGEGPAAGLTVVSDVADEGRFVATDSTTGRVVLRGRLDDGDRVTRVVSRDPFVVEAGDDTLRSVLIIGPDGRPRTIVTGPYDVDGGSGVGSGAPLLRVQGGVIEVGDGAGTVSGYDVETARPLWTLDLDAYLATTSGLVALGAPDVVTTGREVVNGIEHLTRHLSYDLGTLDEGGPASLEPVGQAEVPLAEGKDDLDASESVSGTLFLARVGDTLTAFALPAR